MVPDVDAELTAIFEERAEDLSRQELWKWSAETGRDRELLTKLKGSGANLLSGPRGPRGSGKSTLLRKAYFELLDDCCVPVPSVLVFDKAGKLLQFWGGPGDPGFLETKCRQAGEFHWPHMVAPDSDGNVYVGEVGGAGRTQKFLRHGATGCTGTGNAEVGKYLE